MEILFVLVSIVWSIITIKIWHKQAYPLELKPHLIILLLGLLAFNAVLGLMFLFNTIEMGDIHLLTEGRLLSMVCLCIYNVLFFGVFAVLIFINSEKRNQHA